MTRRKKTRKKRILTPYALDNIGKRELVPIKKKYAIRNVDQLNRASDFKKNKNIHNDMKEEYIRRLVLQTRKSKKSRKLFQKMHKTKKKPINYIKRMSAKNIEDTYFYLLKQDKPRKPRRRRKRGKRRSSKK
jgi:hypothetical protein